MNNNGIILKLSFCPFLNILCDDIQISRTSLPRCRVDMPARGCRWSVRGGRGVLQGGGGRASTPPWWRGSPGTAAAQPVGSIESTGRETSPSRQVCSIPPAQLSLGSSDVKKTLPLVEPAPPLSLPHACREIIIQTYSCNAKIPKRLRSLSSIVYLYKIRPEQ